MIQTQVHTIFMLIGPTECGKTSFAKHVLMPQLGFADPNKNFLANVQYISSDAIRQELLGHEHDKYDATMTESSGQAFDMLFAKLRAVTSFPVNAEFAIVDTTGLSESFRGEIVKIAKDNHYNLEAILFDYKNREDYYASDRSKKLISNHVTRLRRDAIPNLRSRDYKKVHKIKAKNFCDPRTGWRNTDYTVEIEDKDQYLEHALSHEYKYAVIGDVHEQADELKELVTAHGFSVQDGKMTPSEKTENMRFILIGDFIDKGGKTEEIIRFIADNQEWFLLVKGNHENYVYKHLTGELYDRGEQNNASLTHFDSIPRLEQNESLREAFFALARLSKPFYRFIGKNSPSFYVTHAPAKTRFIGKLDEVSQKNQRRFQIDREKPIQGQLAYLEAEGETNQPYHVFGHIAAKETFQVKNKLGIDTGCVNGNKLTSVSLDSRKPFFRSVKSNAEKNEDLPILFKREPNLVRLDELDEADQRRLEFIVRNKINFISGTMSPADKDEEKGDLESLEKGLLYFKNKGASKVVLQPKYMGSRCNLYLSPDSENCIATSRNGYKIEHLDLTGVYESMRQKFGAMMRERRIAMIAFDGELLPWMALGKGLINRQFKAVEKALETETAFLKQHGFDASFGKLKKTYAESGFDKDRNTVSKQDLITKYGDAVYQTFKHVKEASNTHYPIEMHEEAFQSFKEQLEIFGQEGETAYKPFNILKIVYEDGTEEMPTGTVSEIYASISEDEFLLLDLDQADSFARAKAFFDRVTLDQKMEGVVIKPEMIAPKIAPYMKVRNRKYLMIVYGYDYRFPHKHQKLMKQKSIEQKLRTSIVEHNLGNAMLAHSMESINPSNHAYRQTVANMMFEAKKERGIDPRL